MNDNSRTAIGARVASARKLRGLNQSELGRKVGMHQMQVSRTEKGERSLGLDEAVLFGDALDCTISYFATGAVSGATDREERLSRRNAELMDIIDGVRNLIEENR